MSVEPDVLFPNGGVLGVQCYIDDPIQGRIPWDGVVSVGPTVGGATSAKQDDQTALLTTISGKLTSPLVVTGAVSVTGSVNATVSGSVALTTTAINSTVSGSVAITNTAFNATISNAILATISGSVAITNTAFNATISNAITATISNAINTTVTNAILATVSGSVAVTNTAINATISNTILATVTGSVALTTTAINATVSGNVAVTNFVDLGAGTTSSTVIRFVLPVEQVGGVDNSPWSNSLLDRLMKIEKAVIRNTQITASEVSNKQIVALLTKTQAASPSLPLLRGLR